MPDRWQGVALGLLSALFWALYNVGAKKGQVDGFTPADLTFLRFFGGALLFLPLVLAPGRIPPLGKVVALALCIGPGFGLILNTGFRYAPLSHGVLIGPCMSMLVTNLLIWALHGQRPSLDRLLGALIVVAGLAIIARSQEGAAPGAGPVWLGDLMFVTSGSLWGVYVYLMGRWQLPAVGVTALVGLVSTLAFLPVYLWLGPTSHAPMAWAEQFLYHGAIGGAAAFVVFAVTVNRIGPSTASLFSALVPPIAVLVAIPLLGDIPSGMQWAGIGLATLGMAIALEARQQIGRRPRG